MVIWIALMATVRRTVVSTVCYPGSPVHIPSPNGDFTMLCVSACEECRKQKGTEQAEVLHGGE